MTIAPYVNDNREHESPIGVYRVALGLTISEFCEKTGVNQTFFSGIQNGTISPLYEKGERANTLKPDAKKICDFLNIDVEEAFPRYFCKITKQGNGFTEDQIEKLIGQKIQTPEQLFIKQELHGTIKKILSTITPIEEKVLRLRFGFKNTCGQTLEEVGKVFNVTRNRVRQIEARALRKLRHPSRAGKLIDYVC